MARGEGGHSGGVEMSPEDVVVERLERELRLLESDYSRTIRAGIPLANGSVANGHPGMAALQRRDGSESEEEESAAPEGYSMLPSDEEQGSALEASDSDAEQDSDGAGQQAEDETPADGDANRSAAQDGAAGSVHNRADHGAGLESGGEVKGSGESGVEVAAASLSAEESDCIRVAMSGFELPAPEWAKELDDATLLRHVGAVLEQNCAR